MLSLGPSRTGLPFHSHGKTWLALIHGSKRWLAYPPGFNAPPELQQRFNPLKSVGAWLNEIYPSLQGLPYAPIEPAASGPGSASGAQPAYTRPLECVQRPGDIVYLPEGWVHMTVNVGEAIGIGGQASMKVEDRLGIGRAAVSRNEDNFDGHKFAALALAHQGLEEEHRFKSQLTATSSGLVQLREDNFEQMVLAGEDTWLVHFSLAATGDGSPDDAGAAAASASAGAGAGAGALPPQTARTWNEVASKLRGLVSVGAMNVTRAWAPALAAEIAAGGGLPVARVLLGSADRSSVGACLRDAVALPPALSSSSSSSSPAEAAAAETQDAEREKEAAAGPSSETLVDFAISSTALRGGQRPGSAIAITAKSKRLFAEAERHQRRCLELQPLHPEGHGLLAELLGHAGLADSMRAAIEAAEALYDDLDPDEASPHSLASVYHKLATVYLGVSRSCSACCAVLCCAVLCCALLCCCLFLLSVLRCLCLLSPLLLSLITPLTPTHPPSCSPAPPRRRRPAPKPCPSCAKR